MTILKHITKNSALTGLLLTLLLSMNSCGDVKEDSTQDNNSISAEQTKVDPPKEDILGATFMGNLKAVQQHVKAGSNLNVKDQYGSTPLIIATTFGKTEVAKALIEGGADLSIASGDGSTALHTAAFLCRTEIVQALLANGANKELKNNYGSTALASISAPFDDVKPIYDQLSKDLGPFGFKLDYDRLESARPKIVEMLSQAK